MSPQGYMSDGPPPPEMRGEDQPQPMPPSVIAAQGQRQEQQQGGMQKQAMDMATQKLLEYRNAVEGVMTVLKAVDPESVAIIMPAIEVGKAIEARLQQVQQRSGAKQPSMANMNPAAQAGGTPGQDAAPTPGM